MRKALKKMFLGSLRSAGVFSLAARSQRRRSRLLILCYHGISLADEHRWHPLLYITPEQFRGRLQMLRSFGANVLPLGEGIERLRAHSLPPRSVAITFDDGFYDFARHAMPLLAEFGYPCTLYLTTYYCRYRMPIWNLILNYLLWKAGAAAMDLRALGLGAEVRIGTAAERAAAVEGMLAWAGRAGIGTAEKDGLARGLAERLRIDYDELSRRRLLQLLTPEEVSAAAAAGIDIQLHTHRHRTPRDRDLFLREIRDNRDSIREFTGREAAHFCYPSGVYAADFLPWLAEAGVHSATTCELHLAAAASDPLLLPRLLDDSRVEAVDFQRWLCGWRL